MIKKVCINCKHSGLYNENKGKETAEEFTKLIGKIHCWKHSKTVKIAQKEKCFEVKK